MSTRSVAVHRRRIAEEYIDDGGNTHRFGLVPDDSPTPDLADLSVTLMPMRFTGGINRPGQAGVITREVSGADYGGVAPEVDSPDSASLTRGEVAGSTPIYSNPNPAAPFDTLDRTPVAVALGSGLYPRYAGDANRTKAISSVDDAHNLTLADGTGLEAGMLVAFDVNGTRSVDLITQVSAAAVKLLCGAHATLVAGTNVLRVGAQYDLTAHGDMGPSVVDVLDLIDERVVGYGGRLTSLGLDFVAGGEVDANAQVDANLTIRYAGFKDQSADSAVTDKSAVRGKNSTPANRKVAETARGIMRISSTHTQSDDADTVAPVSGLAATTVEVESMTLSVALGMQNVGHSSSELGISDQAPQANPEATLELIVKTTDSFINTLRGKFFGTDENYHAVMLAFGPTGAHGMGIVMPAAVLTDDPKSLDANKGYRRFILRFRAAASHIVDKADDRAALKIALF